MPNIHQSIIVKVIDLPYLKGEDVFLKVVMFGDPKQYEFEMKITKTMWYSIYRHMKSLEDDPFNLFMNDVAFKIDEKLSYLKGRVLTIKGIPDMSRSFETKKGKIEFAKVFDVTFEGELENAERIGGDTYVKAVFDGVINNLSCEQCRKVNIFYMKEDIKKKEEKEKIKEEKNKQIIENNKKKDLKKTELIKTVDIEWIKKRKVEDEKKAAKLKKLEFCGW